MTREEKQLLFIDLCGRLPYGVKVTDVIDNKIVGFPYTLTIYLNVEYTRVLPYLRPMSSMTEEEKKELFNLCTLVESEDWEGKKTEYFAAEIASRFDSVHNYDTSFNFYVDSRAFDWLDRKMFDYRDLIPKGLAIEAPDGMYKSEEQQ